MPGIDLAFRQSGVGAFFSSGSRAAPAARLKRLPELLLDAAQLVQLGGLHLVKGL